MEYDPANNDPPSFILITVDMRFPITSEIPIGLNILLLSNMLFPWKEVIIKFPTPPFDEGLSTCLII